ncbi:MAG: type II toxin-antitoxin system HicA family toxin [Terriglobales bacterium]
MRLPRDLSGHELIRLLRRYGYEQTRQVGSHIRLQSSLRGHPHNLTVPDHGSLRLGTLSAILSEWRVTWVLSARVWNRSFSVDSSGNCFS